jgi:hypothetical protein
LIEAELREIGVMSSAMKAAIAAMLTFAIATAAAQGASASGKRHHHQAKPSEQYLRSAAPPADKAQK